MSEKLVEANSTKCEAQVRETRGYHIHVPLEVS